MQGMLLMLKLVNRPKTTPEVFFCSTFFLHLGFDFVFIVFFMFPPSWRCICLRIHLSSAVFTKAGFDPCVEGSLLYNWQFSQHQYPALRARGAGFCLTNGPESTAAITQTPAALWSGLAGEHQPGVGALKQQPSGRCNAALAGTDAAGC